MTRFLMSLEDSVDLVLHAFKHSKQGDIFVQKSPAATINDLAKSLTHIFSAKNQIKIIIVLRRNPYDLIPVYKDRKYSNKKIRENAGSEILGIIAHDTMSEFQEKTFQINVSGKTISEVVEKVIDLISNNEGNEEVDWLELVRKNNDLGKFFAD